MEDIAPGLLEKIREEFKKGISENDAVNALYKKIKGGAASYRDAQEYAYLVGDELSKAFRKHLTAEALPDGKLYYNIADRVVRPMLMEDHEMISGAAATVQKSLNEKAGIGIRPQVAEVNRDRVQGIVEKVSSAESIEDVSWVLDEPVKNFSQNIVDETIRKNVEFQGKAGLKPRIIRKHERKCCKWCRDLAGEYDYPNVPHDVYRRHENCRCVVEYDPGSGKRQNVHTKQWTVSKERAKIEARKIVGLKANGVTVSGVSDHVYDRMAERSVTMEDILDSIEKPLKIGEVKVDEKGRPSFAVVGEKATLYVNPDTGVVTTTHPTHSKTAKKLKGK